MLNASARNETMCLSAICQLLANERSTLAKLGPVDDTVTVFLEPFLDYLRGYTFAVNGYGVQRDSIQP